MQFFTGLKCLRCGHAYGQHAPLAGCSECATPRSRSNLTCDYDYDAIAGERAFENGVSGHGLWRWDLLLPIGAREAVTLREGDTPLLPCPALAAAWGLEELYVKDESRNPTWSYKDRLNTVAVSVARKLGARVITVASTGNHGASTAAYAARAGLPCVVFTTTSVPQTMKTLMQSYGAYVVALPTLEDRWRVMGEAVGKLGWFATSNGTWPPVGSTPYGIEGYKTLGYELAEEFGFEAPDRVVVPVAFGDGLYGIWKGFQELRRLGLLQGELPRMTAAEPLGPLAHALERGLKEGEPVPAGKTVAFSIGASLSTHQALTALRESGGDALTADDEAILQAQADLATYEGIYAEPSSAAALAAVRKGVETGRIDPAERIVVVLTSSGLKDPGATAPRLGPVPAPEPTLDGVLKTLREVYGFSPGASVS